MVVQIQQKRHSDGSLDFGGATYWQKRVLATGTKLRNDCGKAAVRDRWAAAVVE